MPKENCHLSKSNWPAIYFFHFFVNEFSVPALSLLRSDWSAVVILHYSVNLFPSVLNLSIFDPVIGPQSPTQGGVNASAPLANCLSERFLM